MHWTELNPEQVRFLKSEIERRMKIELLPVLEELEVDVERIQKLRISASGCVGLIISCVRDLNRQVRESRSLARRLSRDLYVEKQISLEHHQYYKQPTGG